MKKLSMRLVLGLTGLPGAEIALVKTILRLSSSLDANWVVAERGDCDVLLKGEAGEQRPDPATVVVTVVQRGQPANGLTLHRPIRAEELIDLLNAESARRTASETAGPPDSIAPVSTQPLGGQARLRRWPPFALLQGRPRHLQLATLLSKHALSASRLSRVANRPLEECEAFLRELDAHNLLVWQPAAAAAPAARSPAAAHAQPRRGLLHTLREKLGIARGRA